MNKITKIFSFEIPYIIVLRSVYIFAESTFVLSRDPKVRLALWAQPASRKVTRPLVHLLMIEYSILIMPLKGLSQIHRAPYDFRTRRLAVEFRNRAGPFRISFLRRPWSHNQRSPDDAR